jgi:hypothetical protein
MVLTSIATVFSTAQYLATVSQIQPGREAQPMGQLDQAEFRLL